MIAVVHGMVDDYLYNGNGALLALFLAGVSAAVTRESHADMKPFTQWDRQTTFLVSFNWYLFSCFSVP